MCLVKYFVKNTVCYLSYLSLVGAKSAFESIKWYFHIIFILHSVYYMHYAIVNLDKKGLYLCVCVSCALKGSTIAFSIIDSSVCMIDSSR